LQALQNFSMNAQTVHIHTALEGDKAGRCVQVQQGFSMPAGQLMGLDDHPLPHGQGLAHTTDRPLFQGSTLAGHQTHVMNASPPHHDVGSEVRLPESLPFRLSWSIHNIFPNSLFVIIHHHLSSFVIVSINTHLAKKLQQVSQHMQWCTMPMTSWLPSPELYIVRLLCYMLCVDFAAVMQLL